MSVGIPFAPVGAAVTRVDNIAATLRTAILRGLLHPGEHLCQHTLARQFEVSKLPVREALKQLYAERLLQYDRNRGYFVMRFTADEAKQIYALRRWLENQLLVSLEWPDSGGLAEFRDLREQLKDAEKGASRTAWHGALARLRRFLFDLSPQKTLLREAERLWAQMDCFHSFFAPEGPYDFAAALEAQDRSSLLSIYAQERDRAEAQLEEAVDALPGLWAVR